mgnify:CR=1 FL=1
MAAKGGEERRLGFKEKGEGRREKDGGVARREAKRGMGSRIGEQQRATERCDGVMRNHVRAIGPVRTSSYGTTGSIIGQNRIRIPLVSITSPQHAQHNVPGGQGR